MVKQQGQDMCEKVVAYVVVASMEILPVHQVHLFYFLQ